MLHFIKYNLIGLLNTAVTVMVVFVLHDLLHWNLLLCNFLGYVAGGLNSYLLNRSWNFRSQNRRGPEIIRFIIVFAVSYVLNLGVLVAAEKVLQTAALLHGLTAFLNQWFSTGFIAHVMANVVYVVVSYSLYKKWVFAKAKS